MVDTKYCLLKNLNLFSRLNESDLNALYAFSNFQTAKEDGIIYPSSRSIDKIYILSQGRIKISFCMEKDVEIVSEILTEGDLFGGLALKESLNTNREFAQVLSDEASFFSFGLNDFKSILEKNATLASSFSEMVALKINIISKKYCDLVFKDVRARVLNFFILHAQYEGKWTGNRAEIEMLCSHRDIARFTAASRQTVSTIINDLVKEKKIIYEGRSHVIIPDIKRLEA